MIKIKSINIRSYRSCINTKLELNNKLTALIGINGVGKSTLLNAILLFERAFHNNYYRYRNVKGSNICHLNIVIEYKGKDVQIKGKVSFNTDEINLDEITAVDLKWNFKEILGISDWMDIPMDDFSLNRINSFYKGNVVFLGGGKVYKVEDIKVIEKAIPYVKEIIEFLHSTKYYSASQFSNPTTFPNFVEIEEKESIRRNRFLETNEKFVFDLYQAHISNNKEYKQFLNTINKTGIGLVDDLRWKELPMPTNTFEVHSGGEVIKKEKNRTLVVPSFIIDGNALSPNQLSEGTIRTIALIFYIITDKSRLLLIEEPEVCVHHGLLSSIISLIKTQADNKQIIISTHSDFILDELKPENLVLVKRDSKKGTKAGFLNKILKKSDYLALRRYLKETGNLGEYWKEGGFGNE